MRVLIDTHALLWWASDDPNLSPKARATLASLKTEVLVSAASAWEIATKVRLGKLAGAEAFSSDLRRRITQLGFLELPVSLDHAHRVGSLPGTHKDPFDRMLIAQALALNVPIVSCDAIFDAYHVRRIW